MLFRLFSSTIERDIKAKRERLFRVAYSWCNDPAIADDIVNEALYRALKTKAKLRDKSCLDGWLYKILSNCWYDFLRQKRPLENIDNIVLLDENSPEQLLQQNELIAQVRQSVALLPNGQRQVLTLVDLEGLAYQEVSQILDIPIGTVMSRLNRARKMLKQQLSPDREEKDFGNTELEENAQVKEKAMASQQGVVTLRRVK